MLEICAVHDDAPVGEDRGVPAEAHLGQRAFARGKFRIDRRRPAIEDRRERDHWPALPGRQTTTGTAAPSIAITAPVT